MALKNLGVNFGQEGGSLQALYYLRRSNEYDPQDPQTVNGLAFAYMELRDIELAQRQFQAVLKMKAPEELRGLARNGLREMAARELKARDFCRAYCMLSFLLALKPMARKLQLATVFRDRPPDAIRNSSRHYCFYL